MPRISIVVFATLVLCGGCRQSSTERLDADQQRQLNRIAADTPEDAGNAAAQDGAPVDAGQAYRAGASAPPRKY